MSTTSDEIIEALSHHIGLPPKLPGRQDEYPEKINVELTRRLLDAVIKILNVPGIPYLDEWTSLYQSLESSKNVNAYGGLSKTSIISALKGLQKSNFVYLYVTEQNCGVTVRLNDGQNLNFEVSEASARCEDVLASKNALLWDFPTSAVTIPLSLYHEHDCEDELATFLEKASKESVKYFAAHSLKAKSMTYESRNTVDPAIVSVIFMTILAINGREIYLPLLRKRVRDDVCWNGSGERPWRRSPFWLLLRVAIQRHFCFTLGSELGRLQYKLLMCLFHANFLSEYSAASVIEGGIISHLQKKLVVRIEKLRSEEESFLKNNMSQYQKYKFLRIALEQEFNSSVEQASTKILDQWNLYKKSYSRNICTLPYQAPIQYFNLKMFNSIYYIEDTLRSIQPDPKIKLWEIDKRYRTAFLNSQPKIVFAHKYFKLAEYESEIEKDLQIQRLKPNACSQARCLIVAEKIKQYLKLVGNAYDESPEQKSKMLLLILELWVDMDKCATQCHGLLQEYSSGIPEKTTDVLQLARLQHLERLQQLRGYLKKREIGSKNSSSTIFDQPNKNCFAVRSYDVSAENSDLRLCLSKIECDAEKQRTNKEKEWKQKNEEYARLVAKELSMEHTNPGVHDRGPCSKCYQQRVIKRFEIICHEWPLPTDTILIKTILFELHCPVEFAEYRDVTWKILTNLALISANKQKASSKFLLRDDKTLSEYGDYSLQSTFTLASKTKPFMMTHFGRVKFPNRLSDIFVPNGTKFAYFDSEHQHWPSQTQIPSFAHQCNLLLPADSFYLSLKSSPEFLGDIPGPTSYAIIASRVNCPNGASVHEFLTLQALYSGLEHRWLQILIELASSNINFSTESVASIINLLALRIGPYDEGNARGIVHKILLKPNFSNMLMDCIDRRMNDISSKKKWREVHCMEILITLLLRVYELATPEDQKRGIELIGKAREVTMKWLFKLRSDEKKDNCTEAIKTRSHYTLWTAMLCRRTFTIFIDNPELISPHLKAYIESSISLQDCLSDDMEALTPLLRAALIRDLKMVWDIRFTLQESLNLEVLMSAIALHYPHLESEYLQNNIELKNLSKPNEWWIAIINNISSDGVKQSMGQTFDFNILTGNLMVNGKPIGKLPEEWKECQSFRHLFGPQALSIWPSSIHGMDYMLKEKIDGNQIHFGTKNAKKIVQILNDKGELMEFLPPEIFSKPGSSDLPSYLLDKCVHWLNLKNQMIEIRRTQFNHWKYRPQNWLIDLRTRRATLALSATNILTLIDPHSRLFKAVAFIFKDFENPYDIVVYQRNHCSLSARLPRLELDFFMNESHNLECRELSSEIDTNQDAGTWHGLKSMLVLRDVTRVPTNHNRWQRIQRETRSILVPTGKVSITRDGPHVEVKVTNDGNYARFVINETLGRLDAVDPNHRYLKAFYHACTSSLIPDFLTGRTGAGEAFHCLNSAYCQPAIPLLEEQEKILECISNLTPHRVYYPSNMKSMQVTHWNHTLTTAIQHDGYRSVVKRIYEESCSLSKFYSKHSCKFPDNFNADENLTMRNFMRRSLYESLPGLDTPSDTTDTLYSGYAIKVHASKMQYFRTFITLLRNWSLPLPQVPDLANLLQGWACFEGFSNPFNKSLLSEIFEDNLSQHWGSLVNTFRNSGRSSKYKLMFLLGMVSFREVKNIGAIIILIAFAISDKLRKLEPPHWPSYANFRKNEKPTVSILINFMGTSYNQIFKKQDVDREQIQFAEFLLKQWPCAIPTVQGSPKFKYIDTSKVMEFICPEWLRMYQNFELTSYISQVQTVLDEICSAKEIYNFELGLNSGIQERKIFNKISRNFNLPKLSIDLLDNFTQEGIITPHIQTSMCLVDNQAREVPSKKLITPPYPHQKVSRMGLAPEIELLEEIVSKFSSSQSTIETQYAGDLTKSLLALQNKRFQPRIIPQLKSSSLPPKIEEAKNNMRLKLRYIQFIVESSYPNKRVELLKQVGLWPLITSIDLLESLRSTSKRNMVPKLKELIVEYAVLITHLQKLYRLQDASHANNMQRWNQELENHGHENWDPKYRTDWLLLEIDANILIRPDQVNVANATISPSSGKNSVLQMNMGQGKTSCIMPMAAATLADGGNLLRVIVPRALLAQTLQLLQTRLGGLVGRKIKHIPFSRKISTIEGLSDEFFCHIKRIQMVSGILVTLPDHILSFQLSGQQALSDGRFSEAKNMLEAQKWISKKSRDIIDECDEILSLRTQLIYPSGTQKIVDGHPLRWEIIESLFKLAEYHLPNINRLLPDSISVTKKKEDGSFPFICFVHEESEELLISRLIDDICSGRSQIIPSYSQEDRSSIKEFISKNNVSDAAVQKVKLLSPENPRILKNIHLLRGIFTQRIFITCLKKRWNVQYGLHPLRDPIAVPYHAKGCPSDQSEWGHPDVAIVLTCLSFYYEGIKVYQLRQTLEHVLKAGDPVQAYGQLIEGSRIPEVFQDWTAINLEDRNQLNELWKHLYLSVNVINFFLNKFVFPLHAKQFEKKLQASSWDIPGCNFQNGNPILPLSTGFSGTNDWKRLLPLTISQQDLPILGHTNAEVLTYLLQERNKHYFIAADDSGRRLSEHDLLRKITQYRVTVLIDAGAQIMEMNNLDLAKAWLDIDMYATAAMYFDQENRPQILHKNGRRTPLYSSTFADNLQGCLVYLDQAHTRGTDLKLPPHAKGALSLGPGQTKDHTVQAAMRLRQLATTQSIIFFAPPEVHRSIINFRRMSNSNNITSVDIVFWLLKQTCTGIEQLLPLYAAQGVEYLRRSQAALSYPKLFNSESRDRQDYLKIIQKVEDFTLEELYGVEGKKKEPALFNQDPMIASFAKELKVRCRGFLGPNKMNGNETLQEVEQEREVANEVQTVRQLQSPVSYTPLQFPCLHAEIRSFVQTGLIFKTATAYEPAFKFIARTSIGKKYNVTTEGTSQKLYVSVEFDRTVHRTGGLKIGSQRVDHLNRPVHWILWSPISEVAMVIIPEEVEIILSMISKDNCVVHLMSYAAPVTRKMLQFNDLTFFNLPPLRSTWQAPTWLRIELGILSGRLYLDQFEYPFLLEFLAVEETDGKIVEANEFPNASATLGIPRKEHTKFVSRPLLFLQEWLAQRRPGQDFSHTPMGHICQGRPLLADHPFFSREENMGAMPEDDEDDREFFGSSEEQLEDDNGNFDFDIINHKQGEEPTMTEFKEESLLQFTELDQNEE